MRRAGLHPGGEAGGKRNPAAARSKKSVKFPALAGLFISKPRMRA